MPYIVTRVKPHEKEVSVWDILNDAVTLDMFDKPTQLQVSRTRTYYYDHISNQKYRSINIPDQIKALQTFYDKFQHLDKGENMHELYNTFYIPKRSSTPGNKKWRRIDAPCEELSAALSLLKTMFEAMMDGCNYHTAAYAYVKGRSRLDAAQKHANNKSNWYLKLDFSNFFGSITLDFIMRMLSEIFPFSEIIKYSAEGRSVVENCIRLCLLDGGLPQGTPMSPTLTNIIMIPIDYKFSQRLNVMKIRKDDGGEYPYVYTRYADDLVISNRDQFNYREVTGWLKEILDYFGAPLTLNDSKTKYCSGAGANWMLGLMINQNHEVTVGHKKKKHLKAAITNYMLDRQNGAKWELEDILHLQGIIAECMYIEEDITKYILGKYSEKYGNVMSAIKSDIKSLTAPKPILPF